VKGPKAMTATERENNFAARLRASGGRPVYTYLTPEATAALARLREGSQRSVSAIVSEALILYAREFSPEDES
jgi:hypothetical protein